MSGKQRKKPLQQGHTFFTESIETQTTINSLAKDKNDKDNKRLVEIKIIYGVHYFLVQKGNETPEIQTISTACNLARKFIVELEDWTKRKQLEIKLENIQRIQWYLT
jgi:hypothetical protein